MSPRPAPNRSNPPDIDDASTAVATAARALEHASLVLADDRAVPRVTTRVLRAARSLVDTVGDLARLCQMHFPDGEQRFERRTAAVEAAAALVEAASQITAATEQLHVAATRAAAAIEGPRHGSQLPGSDLLAEPGQGLDAPADPDASSPHLPPEPLAAGALPEDGVEL